MASNVISGLIRRRRELTYEINELLAKAETIAADVEALDRTLRLFDPGIRLEAIPALQSRPKPDWAVRGEVVLIIFDLLRCASEPLSTRNITAKVHEARGIEGEITFLHIRRVRKCLDRQRARGTLRAVSLNGELCWCLALRWNASSRE